MALFVGRVTVADAGRYERYERASELPLTALAVAFLAVLAAPIIHPRLPAAASLALRVADIGIWLAFAADYLTRLRLTGDRRRFVRGHLIELAAVALPALRPLRLLRLFSIGNMLAARSKRSLIGQAGRLVAAAGAVLVFVAAVAELDAERGAPKANIAGFGDALWWAATTITTVGYGDHYPVTTEGRAIAVGLMVLGIALVGLLTASIAAWFVREVRQSEDEALEPVEVRLARLEAKLDQLLAATERTDTKFV